MIFQDENRHKTIPVSVKISDHQFPDFFKKNLKKFLKIEKLTVRSSTEVIFKICQELVQKKNISFADSSFLLEKMDFSIMCIYSYLHMTD